MQTHKFRIGQQLEFNPSRHEHEDGSGLVEVTRLLPYEGSELQYRIKNRSTGRERVVREGQLHTP